MDFSFKRLFLTATSPLISYDSDATSYSLFTESKGSKEQLKKRLFLDLNQEIEADIRICKTMHHSLVQLLHLICLAGPRSKIFSHLSPAHITTAEDESNFFLFHTDTHLVTASYFSQKMCEHNWENEQPLLIHSQSENRNTETEGYE